MARPTRALLLPLLMLLALTATLARASSGDVPAAASLGWDLGVVGAGEDEEFGFPGGDSVARRVLQGGGYLSYGALRRDNVPCSVRGASYYNCRPGGQANPYSRGCSAITRCRG
ncbi:protein RALF-like 33 [Miscanthus floridulus]|uniref:protein RALF-like 33 n=1 Tax=Miscanthus floridulus TaxID=154761 RepID=UPI00345AE4F3